MDHQSPPTTFTWHTLSAGEAAVALQSDLEAGLQADDAALRQLREGFNELPEAPPPSLFKLFLSQFTSVIVWVLIGAAAVAGLVGDWVNTAAIVAIVLLNGLLGFAQESKAERSLAALRQLSVATARVVRGGQLASIAARDLVSGDLIVLEAGDRIPADARLMYTASFQTQEASLTGESSPVQKDAEPIADAQALLADRLNMAFMGTIATAGKARALVVATGPRTKLGKIAGMIIQATEAERIETPLQRRLEQFGYQLLWLALAVVAVVFGLGYWRGEPLLTLFLTSVSLAVAAVPEGLPAVVTITLALGVTRMAKRHALIRKLPAVETLGSATVICTDKTGTLTKNEMTVTTLVAGDRMFDVTGEGYAPAGEIREAFSEAISTESDGASPVTRHPSLDPGLRELLTAAVLCNGATLREAEGSWRVIGDPTEGALLVAAAKAGLLKAELERSAPVMVERPFDPERKRMTIVRRTATGAVAYVKGAPDGLLSRCTHVMQLDGSICPLADQQRAALLERNTSLAQRALRVLAVATRPLNSSVAGTTDALERNLVFLGLLAMKDPLRPEAIDAVRLCRDAGITTAMITGDHRETAIAIARELGLQNGDAVAFSGSDIDNLTDEQLTQSVDRVTVYARVSAEHKLRIVQAWKRRGAVVAMTGDGVNDAPAIKAADIGVAMGIAGTDVTKEASDMVVTDDNFASIAAAVEEGRAVFDNIRKTVHFLLSCNVSEVFVMLFAALLGLPIPLLPIQILWMNLVTDGIPALALAVDPKAPDLMQRRPRHPDARLFDGRRLLAIGSEGLLLALLGLGAFVYCLYGLRQGIEQARTVVFSVMVLAQLIHAFNCRSERLSLLRLGIGTNPALLWAVLVSWAIQVAVLSWPVAGPVFKVVPLPWEDWILMGCAALVPLIVVEGMKWRRRARRESSVKHNQEGLWRNR